MRVLHRHGATFDVRHHGGASWVDRLRERGDDVVIAAVEKRLAASP